MYKRMVGVVYMDFGKAFDKIHNDRLFQKIKMQEILGDAVWIQNLLNHRRYKVAVDGFYSGCKSVASGIPQGSVLGLIVIYINDLGQKCR